MEEAIRCELLVLLREIETTLCTDSITNCDSCAVLRVQEYKAERTKKHLQNIYKLLKD